VRAAKAIITGEIIKSYTTPLKDQLGSRSLDSKTNQSNSIVFKSVVMLAKKDVAVHVSFLLSK
jgi:hypothetical protein